MNNCTVATLCPVSFRLMHASDAHFAVEMAALEGWEPGLNDAQVFFSAAPTGFFVGTIGDEQISCISAVRYRRTAFIGFFVVKKQWRNMGYGMKTWQVGLDQVKDLTVGLDAVAAQVSKYKKSGFVSSHENFRYSSLASRLHACNVSDAPILNISDVPLDEVRAFDTEAFGDERTSFLDAWISQPGCVALVWHHKSGVLQGFVVARPTASTWKVLQFYSYFDRQKFLFFNNILVRRVHSVEYACEFCVPS